MLCGPSTFTGVSQLCCYFSVEHRVEVPLREFLSVEHSVRFMLVQVINEIAEHHEFIAGLKDDMVREFRHSVSAFTLLAKYHLPINDFFYTIPFVFQDIDIVSICLDHIKNGFRSEVFQRGERTKITVIPGAGREDSLLNPPNESKLNHLELLVGSISYLTSNLPVIPLKLAIFVDYILIVGIKFPDVLGDHVGDDVFVRHILKHALIHSGNHITGEISTCFNTLFVIILYSLIFPQQVVIHLVIRPDVCGIAVRHFCFGDRVVLVLRIIYLPCTCFDGLVHFLVEHVLKRKSSQVVHSFQGTIYHVGQSLVVGTQFTKIMVVSLDTKECQKSIPGSLGNFLDSLDEVRDVEHHNILRTGVSKDFLIDPTISCCLIFRVTFYIDGEVLWIDIFREFTARCVGAVLQSPKPINCLQNTHPFFFCFCSHTSIYIKKRLYYYTIIYIISQNNALWI